ncbi:TPA: hypothetical protein ACHIEN_004974, partial [Serratia marcescens]
LCRVVIAVLRDDLVNRYMWRSNSVLLNLRMAFASSNVSDFLINCLANRTNMWLVMGICDRGYHSILIMTVHIADISVFIRYQPGERDEKDSVSDGIAVY